MRSGPSCALRSEIDSPKSSCAGLTRASIDSVSPNNWMDCRVKPGNDDR
jgi:hypothetical protein